MRCILVVRAGEVLEAPGAVWRFEAAISSSARG